MKLLKNRTFETIINGIFGNIDRKIYLDGKSKQILKDDILIYYSNNKIYFYKAKKNGMITIPTDEYCEKLFVGGNSFVYEELKKKILNG